MGNESNENNKKGRFEPAGVQSDLVYLVGLEPLSQTKLVESAASQTWV